MWVCESRGVSVAWWFVGSCDGFAGGEGGFGADEGDEVGGVDGTPAGLPGFRATCATVFPGSRTTGPRPRGTPDRLASLLWHGTPLWPMPPRSGGNLTVWALSPRVVRLAPVFHEGGRWCVGAG